MNLKEKYLSFNQLWYNKKIEIASINNKKINCRKSFPKEQG